MKLSKSKNIMHDGLGLKSIWKTWWKNMDGNGLIPEFWQESGWSQAAKFVSVFVFWFDLEFIHKSLSRSKWWPKNMGFEQQHYENSIESHHFQQDDIFFCGDPGFHGILWDLKGTHLPIFTNAISSRAVVVPDVFVPWTTPGAKPRCFCQNQSETWKHIEGLQFRPFQMEPLQNTTQT